MSGLQTITELRNERDALAVRLAAAEEALRAVRAVFPQGVCSECAGFEHEVAEANGIIDAALAGEPQR